MEKLCSESEAGSQVMRFPWRRDLVPVPEDHNVGEDDGEPKAWNPPLDQCQASPLLTSDDLLTRATDKVLDRRLRNLQSHAKLAISEQGVHAVFAVFGFLKWFEKRSIGGEEVVRCSPLVLVPVTLERASAGAAWEVLEAEDDAYGNLCLRQRLLQDYQVQLPDLPSIDQLEEPEARLDYLDAVREAIKNEDQWEVEERCVIGRFAFPKIAMWEDLGAHRDEVADHPLTRKLADDASVEPELAYGPIEDCPKAKDLDDTFAPGEIKTILDCDSSQLEAIVAARRGVSFVLDGPPGTGKSQTIANIVAEALGAGRTVLFVSEKSAALDVVKRRLDEKGLGDFCLECHSSKANRKAVLYEMEQCLNLPGESYPSTDVQLGELRKIREGLNSYVRCLHRVAAPLGMSAFDVFGHISKLQKHSHDGTSRCMLPDATTEAQQTIRTWHSLLEQASDHASVLEDYAGHSWRDCLLTSRPLSFTGDLRQNAVAFSEAVLAIGVATQPLVDQGVLPSVTLGNVVQVQADVAAAADSPNVASRWLDSPQEFATTILEISRLQDREQELRKSLSKYTDNAASQFAARESEFDASSFLAAQASLGAAADSSLRTFAERLANHVTLLAQLRSLATDVDNSLTQVLESTQVPLNPRQPLKAIPQIAKIIQKLIAMSPLRSAWFRKDDSSSILSAADGSLSDLKEVAKLVSERSGNWVAGGTLSEHLARGTADFWTTVGAFTEANSVQHLEGLHDTYTSLNSSIRQTRTAASQLFEAVGATDQGVTLHTVTAAAESFAELRSLELIQSTWCDHNVLGQLTKQLPEIIEELGEAAQIRSDLSERLSHRAFREESGILVKNVDRFSSMFGRMGKPFKQFKIAVADLYRSELPPRDQMLADCRTLATFHRRFGMARELAEELAAHLPEGCDVVDPNAMKRIQEVADSLSCSFRQFDSVVGQPRALINSFDAVALVDASRQLLTAAESLSDLPEGLSNQPLDTIDTTAAQRTDAIVNGLNFLQSADGCYDGDVPSADVIIRDVSLTERISILLTSVSSRRANFEDWSSPKKVGAYPVWYISDHKER